MKYTIIPIYDLSDGYYYAYIRNTSDNRKSVALFEVNNDMFKVQCVTDSIKNIKSIFKYDVMYRSEAPHSDPYGTPREAVKTRDHHSCTVYSMEQSEYLENLIGGI